MWARTFPRPSQGRGELREDDHGSRASRQKQRPGRPPQGRGELREDDHGSRASRQKQRPGRPPQGRGELRNTTTAAEPHDRSNAKAR
ncbi:hypothetical protein GCM10010515_64860 [Streptomyces fructofermentans]|uniref:Uncharacterized protein n=1 Tax=Streptomyces fructofermentans TaxID=152141 RepID=A0A918U3X3_9ACTN|nr:hypothetical protein GCM10010515_64860 [Streptomyces fructofermentans]